MRADAALVQLDEICVRAPAKINLNLHVAGRRPDGYHELGGLVVFADIADELRFKPVPVPHKKKDNSDWSLEVSGPFADFLHPSQGVGDNLILKAVRLFGEQVQDGLGVDFGGTITLQKNLPVAAGIGGGSADAAATLNALQQMYSFPLDDHQLQEVAVKLGADVPMCLTPTAQMIAGIGEIRKKVSRFQPLPAVLVNPRLGVSTALVFGELSAPILSARRGVVIEPFNDFKKFVDQRDVIDWLQTQRNDLQQPAIRLAPVISDVLEVLGDNDSCRLARMSGSGATCFGLYDSDEAAAQAAGKISAVHPDWWTSATVLS